MDDRAGVGQAAEEVVAALLQAEGCTILARNARDRSGELDLVARREGQILVVEVRSRRGGCFDDVLDSIRQDKRRRVRRMAARWLSERSLLFVEVRFCVAAVVWRAGTPRVRFIEDAF